MSRVVSLVKEYKEILVLLAAVGSAVAVARNPTGLPEQVTLRQVAAQIDSMSRQMSALVRLQCATADRSQAALSGLKCP